MLYVKVVKPLFFALTAVECAGFFAPPAPWRKESRLKIVDFHKSKCEKASLKTRCTDTTNVVALSSLKERKKEDEYKKALNNILARAQELDW